MLHKTRLSSGDLKKGRIHGCGTKLRFMRGRRLRWAFLGGRDFRGFDPIWRRCGRRGRDLLWEDEECPQKGTVFSIALFNLGWR